MWINLGKVVNNKFYAEIYHDNKNGDKWVASWFKINEAYKKTGDIVDKNYLEKNISAFDGSQIFITFANHTLTYPAEQIDSPIKGN